MRVLGIDASLACTGWGLVDMADDGAVNFVAAGTIEPKLNDDEHGPMSRELATAMQITEPWMKYQPHFAYIEETACLRNALVMRKLTRLSGMICFSIYVTSGMRVHVSPMTSAEWRSRVGMVKDAKDAVYQTFLACFGQLSPFGVDATEAALIALAGAQELVGGEVCE